jgi:hypothetical protein
VTGSESAGVTVEPDSATPRLGWPGVSVLSAIALGLGLDFALWLRPGPFLIDEITYGLMAKSAAEGRPFIWNGYEELASQELESLQIRATPGGLSAQYPEGYALLAAPFRALFGYSGLFLLNACAFLIAAALCQKLAHRVLGNARAAALATALWAFATYSWEYALAIWPHSVALAAILGCALFVFDGVERAEDPRAFRRLLAGGLCVGFGLTVRLDVLLCAGPLLLPLLSRGRTGLKLGLGFALGLVPGALLASALNLRKWGSLLPISYGDAEHTQVVPWALAALVGLAALAFQQRARLVRVLGGRGLALALAVAALTLVVVPATRRMLLDTLTGTFALVVDSSALPVDPTAVVLERRESGAAVYAGVLKKAVLQNCPYFTLGLAGLFVAFRDPSKRSAAWLLAGTPLAYFLFYGVSAWHGGLCYNMRYLLPALPFAAMASVLGLRALVAARRAWPPCVVGGAAALALTLVVSPRGAGLETAEPFLLLLPLLIAAVLGLCAVWALLRSSRISKLATAALAGFGITHAACTGFGYDLGCSRWLRAANFDSAAAVAEHVRDDSLVFAQYPDPFYALVEIRQRIRIALPLRDRFHDFRRLASFHASHGRGVYAVLTPAMWHKLENSDKLEGFLTRPIALIGAFELRELVETERTASAAARDTLTIRPRYPRTLRN